MKYLRINNINPEEPACTIDYKGLDISLFVPGSSMYDDNISYCYTITTQVKLPVHEDIMEVDESEYLQFKASKIKSTPSTTPSLEERLTAAESKNVELTQAVAELSMTLAAMMGA